MFMAAHGLRDMGEGAEKVANPAEACALKRRARQILLWSAATSAAMTGMAVAAVLIR
jgi:hypothetical protein